MDKIKATLLGVAVLVVIVFALGLPSTGDAAAVKVDVRVVNPPSQPVPVAGKVGITGEVPVTGTVGIAGPVSVTGNVGIAGSPTVVLGNTAANPVVTRSADDPGRVGFVRNFSVTLGSGMNGQWTITAVPAGKRAVVEFASVRLILQKGQNGLVYLSADNPFCEAYLVLTHQYSWSWMENFVASQPVRMYANPEVEIRFNFERDADAGDAMIYATIAGYFVDIQ
jgi:hypothetical protein